MMKHGKQLMMLANRYKVLVLISSLLIILACGSRKSKVNRSGLIPADDLTALITDLYITNGLITVPRIHQWYTPSDTLTPYIDVIKKHGFTKEELDRTMRWYFVKKPKKLIKIYDKALANLSEMEARFQLESEAALSKIKNLWTGPDFYAAPRGTGVDSSSFEIKLNYPGVYTLLFTASVFPDDQITKPGFTAYTINADSLETGKKTYLRSISYIKDGRPHRYSVFINASNQIHFCIKGWFMNTCSSDSVNRHYLVRDVSISAIGNL